jgi:hypothetical protein
MKASDVTFQQMLAAGKKNPQLGKACSYMQVEYGIKELETCWQGFVDTSDHAEQNFRYRKQVCAEFGDALSDYIEFLGESLSVEVGS